MSRFVVVNNQDSHIHYEGDWSLTNSSIFQNIGTLGPPLESSLRTTTTNGSFSFSFSGSSISVLGTATSGDQPNVQCFLDGVSFAASLEGPDNNIHICTQAFADEQHELIVNVSTQGAPFFLDNLQYQPSADVPLDNATIIISSGDPSISFSIGWKMVDGFPQNMTQTTNAFANVTFIGDRLSWFGTFLEGQPQTPSPAEYSVDGSESISFTLKLPPGQTNSSNIFDIPFFATDVLEQGSHTVTVRYLGNDSTIPLTLNNLLVTNASNPSSAPSSSTSSNPSGTKTSSNPSPTSQSRSARGSSAGTIAGAVVGSVGFLSVILILILIRKYFIRKQRSVDSYTAVAPFEVDRNRPPLTHQLTSYHITQTSVAQSVTVPTATEDTRRTPGKNTLDRSEGPSKITSTSSHYHTLSTTSNEVQVSSSTTESNPEQRDSTDRGSLPQLPLHVRHEDSGLRIPSSGDSIIELPPTYTIN